MLPNEAKWLAKAIQQFPPSDVFPMLNLGSSTGEFRARQQPWIDDEIFGPLSDRGLEVVHTDIKDAPGIDLVGDLTDRSFFDMLTQRGFKSVMCSNLFEHVENRDELARLTTEVVAPGGLIFASCPSSYPYHPDPIDTRFRPNVQELAGLFPNTNLEFGDIITGGRALDRFRGRSELLVDQAKRATAVSDRVSWLAAKVGYLPYLIRHFEATCVVVRRR